MPKLDVDYREYFDSGVFLQPQDREIYLELARIVLQLNVIQASVAFPSLNYIRKDLRMHSSNNTVDAILALARTLHKLSVKQLYKN